MVIFHSYVSLPEGTPTKKVNNPPLNVLANSFTPSFLEQEGCATTHGEQMRLDTTVARSGTPRGVSHSDVVSFFEFGPRIFDRFCSFAAESGFLPPRFKGEKKMLDVKCAQSCRMGSFILEGCANRLMNHVQVLWIRLRCRMYKDAQKDQTEALSFHDGNAEALGPLGCDALRTHSWLNFT
jgi:hypothetical protein